MIVKEITSATVTIRIHDESCRPVTEFQLDSISRIVSASYQKRCLSTRQKENHLPIIPS